MEQLCVAFDLDDTLFLEMDYVRSGFDAVGEWVNRQLGIGDFKERAWKCFEGGRRGDIFDEVLKQTGCGHDKSLVEELVRVYRTHKPHIALLPDAEVCLNFLRGRTAVAIISDGPVPSQRAKIEALGLEQLVEEFVLTGHWGPEYAKPHPCAFEYVQRRWGTSCSKFVYVGDNPVKDFTAPRALGWLTVRVHRAEGLYYSAPNSGGLGAELEVHDLLEFLGALWPDWGQQ